MKRASKSIALVLITSATILQGCDDSSTSQDSSGGDWNDDSGYVSSGQYHSSTQPTSQRSGYSRSYHSYGYGGSHYWFSSSGNAGRSGSGSFGSSGSASHSSGTSRGGFGSTGHGGGS